MAKSACQPQIRRQSSETGLVESGYFFQFIILKFSNWFASHLLISLRSDDDCDVELEATRNNHKELFRQKNVSPYSWFHFNFKSHLVFSSRSDVRISDFGRIRVRLSAAFQQLFRQGYVSSNHCHGSVYFCDYCSLCMQKPWMSSCGMSMSEVP